MKLISYNYAQVSSTVVDSSSQSIYHPANNLKHEFRSKEWRSSTGGYFKINGSNTISFTDFLDSSYSVSIINGVYTGSSLATAIKVVLEAVTTQEFSVSKSETTGLWSITSEDNFSINSVGFLNTYCGFSLGTYSGSNSYTGSMISLHTEEYVSFDLRTTEEIDSIVLMWQKGNLRISPDAVIRVEANATNNWGSPAFSQVMTINEVYEMASLYLSESESYRYWRVVILDRGNPYLYVSLGTIILGKSEELQNPDNGFSWSITDTSRSVSNEYNNTWTDEYPQLNTLSINFNLLDYDVAETLEQVFKRVGNRKPIFIALEHTGSVFDKDNYSIYGKLNSNFGLNHIMHKYLSSGLTITEVL